jgi:hypothetical protein
MSASESEKQISPLFGLRLAASGAKRSLGCAVSTDSELHGVANRRGQHCTRTVLIQTGTVTIYWRTPSRGHRLRRGRAEPRIRPLNDPQTKFLADRAVPAGVPALHRLRLSHGARIPKHPAQRHCFRVERFDNGLRRRGTKAVDVVRAGDRLRLRGPNAREAGRSWSRCPRSRSAAHRH